MNEGHLDAKHVIFHRHKPVRHGVNSVWKSFQHILRHHVNIAHSIKDAADGIEKQSPQVARMVRSAAEGVERISTDFRDCNVGELLDSVTKFAQRQPAAVFGAARTGENETDDTPLTHVNFTPKEIANADDELASMIAARVEGVRDYATVAMHWSAIDVMRNRQTGAIAREAGQPWLLSAIQETDS